MKKVIISLFILLLPIITYFGYCNYYVNNNNNDLNNNSNNNNINESNNTLNYNNNNSKLDLNKITKVESRNENIILNNDDNN